jgi:hypothetical protein
MADNRSLNNLHSLVISPFILCNSFDTVLGNGQTLVISKCITELTPLVFSAFHWGVFFWNLILHLVKKISEERLRNRDDRSQESIALDRT